MASLPPGTSMGQGRYTIVRELNRGGTAVVYAAIDAHSGLDVALKVMTPASTPKQAAASLRAAQREIKFASCAMQHPSICELLDYFSEPAAEATAGGGGDRLCLVWELVQGMDLLDTLNAHGGVLGEPMAAPLFAQLVRAVMFIHSQGMAHRDVKPENCMIEAGTGRLLLIDFGLSKGMMSACTLGVGTPDYLAPELLGSSGDFRLLYERQTGSYSAAAVDTWSMGVTLYLLITGHYPFEDPAASHNVLATLNNAKAGKYRPLPASVSEACRDLIGRLLTVDPAKRITLSAALAHPWLVAHGVGCAASSSESAGDVDVQAGSAAPAAAAPMPEAFSFPQPLPHMVTPATPTVVGAPDAPKAPGLLGPSSIAIVASAATAPGSSCSPVAAPVSPSFSRGGPAAGEAEAEAGGKRQRLFAFGCFSGLLNFLF